MRGSVTWTSVALVASLGASACGGGSQAERPSDEAAGESPAGVEWVSAEDYDADLFGDSANVEHRWFPLQPGDRLDYRGSSLDEGERLFHGVTIIVTDLVKVIDGVENVVVWERDYSDGELVETELALFAQDEAGNIWHMGEYPEEWEDGEFDKAPAWVHGVAGATAGITIPAEPATGTPDYAQGYAPPPISWVDRGRVYKTGGETCVPADCYADVVVIEEFEKTIPDAFQDKFYAPGVGVVRVGWRGKNDESKETLELVEFRELTPEELADVREEALALEERAYEISKDVWGTTPPSEPSGG
ncbi:MAG TPA: hypothetical protein VLB29_13070 [Nocardioidaceae bacterium]|nr:hypothetical protein [Nocardioidaceae bacterium]